MNDIILFMFDDAGGGEADSYVQKTMAVAMDMLREALSDAPDVGWVEYVPESRVPSEAKLTHAREVGARYVVSGEFEQLRENVSITVEWFDLATEKSGRRRTGLGRTQLEDFDLVARQMGELAMWFHEDRRREVSEDIEIIRVSCFSGAQGSEFGYLDRFITLQLPQYLGPMLEQEGVSAVRVVGLSFDGYEGKCAARGYSEELPGEARYEISGTVIPQRDAASVEALLFDRQGSRALSIGGLELQGEAVRQIPRQLAERLAPTLKIVLTQERLNAKGYGPVYITGEFTPDMREVIQNLQSREGLTATGEIDEAVLRVLGLRLPKQ